MAPMNLTCAVNEKEKLAWRGGAPVRSTRVVAEERAIALAYCGSTYAVLMATPDDLEDFGRGFSITEGIVERLEEIKSIESVENERDCRPGRMRPVRHRKP
jgi:FdhD protein